MKGSKCIKFLTFSIISLLCCVIFSNATSAIELTIDTEPTGKIFTVSNVICSYMDGTTITRSGNCINPNPNNSGVSNLKQFKTSTQLDVEEGNYYRTFLEIKSISQYPEILWSIGTNTYYWDIVSWHLVSQDEVARAGEITGLDQPNVPAGIGMTDDMYATFYEVVLRAKNTGKAAFALGNNTNAFIYSPVHPTQDEVYIGMKTIEEFKPSGATAMNEKDDEDRDNIESQSSDNQTEADEQGGEADQTGQTLMQAFGSLITALTSVQETSCTLPNMSVYSLDLNNIDLCAVNLPTGIAALVGIGMVLIIVPLGINLVKRMINLYKEIVG